MKKLLYLALFILVALVYPLNQINARNFNQNPADVLKDFHEETKEAGGDSIQETKLNNISSKYCNEAVISQQWFTITRTLCNIKMNINSYLEYVMYVWLSAATIFLIRNGFKLVTASDRSKKMGDFTKNLKYIIIWVLLLISFYYIIDIFLSAVNLITR